MASLIIAIIGLVLSAAGYGVAEGMQGWGNDLRQRATKVANQIYAKISRDSRTLDNLYTAYQRRDTELGNAILTGAGFGPSMVALRKEMDKAKSNYEKEKAKLTDEIAKTTNKYNEANNALANAGGGIAQNIGAGKVVSQLEQYVQGGMKNEEEVDKETKSE